MPERRRSDEDDTLIKRLVKVVVVVLGIFLLLENVHSVASAIRAMGNTAYSLVVSLANAVALGLDRLPGLSPSHPSPSPGRPILGAVAITLIAVVSEILLRQKHMRLAEEREEIARVAVGRLIRGIQPADLVSTAKHDREMLSSLSETLIGASSSVARASDIKAEIEHSLIPLKECIAALEEGFSIDTMTAEKSVPLHVAVLNARLDILEATMNRVKKQALTERGILNVVVKSAAMLAALLGFVTALFNLIKG